MGVQCCTLYLAIHAAFFFAQSAPGAPEQSPAQSQRLYQFVSLFESLPLMLLPQQMATNKNVLSTTDLEKISNVLQQRR